MHVPGADNMKGAARISLEMRYNKHIYVNIYAYI